jgi:hypothetical protein
MLSKVPTLKVVLLIRNPLASLYSWYKAPKEFRVEQGWNFDDEWLDAPKKNLDRPEEFNGYKKWKEATLLFHKLKIHYEKQVCIVDYSNLLRTTQMEVERIFDFAGLKVPLQTLDYVEKSTSQNNENPYSVYKVKETDEEWHKLPDYVKSYIYNDLKGTILESYLEK